MAEQVGTRQLRVGSRLEWVLASGAFAVTAEIAPPASASPEDVRRPAALFRGPLGAGEPIMQMVLRDRNRIALQADLLGAAALGIRNVLCLRGDDPQVGNERDAAPVYDLTTEEMISTFRRLRDGGLLRGGDKVEAPPKILIGAAANPFGGSLEERFANLRGKVTAGADFIQTQAIYDVDAFEEWMRLVRKEWLHERVYILPGVIPLRSPKMAKFMAEKVPGVVIPKDILERMHSAPDPKQEGGGRAPPPARSRRPARSRASRGSTSWP